MTLRIKLCDSFILIGVLISIVGISLQVYGSSYDHMTVMIHTTDNQWIYPLDEDTVASIPGPHGEMDVTILNNSVFVEDCDCCPQRICVSTGPIRQPGQWIICMPNEIFIYIDGVMAFDQKVDDVVY